jgi:quercetin dioxygenase-like cupin family protein
MVGKERRSIEPGDVITTQIHEPHGLWATPDQELVLVSSNIYPTVERAQA